ncbi:uncharacterized protein IUM83_14627 [Phytophthora cinnamomi]|uniref:uncharacterized protein n=1 Tax=Phytophthora cinnamomi TaxID=4785 RepID=UPI00355A26D4|nr:hypothetical protein IUM83_14627 [Phytophthora cinnamomi]
MFASTRQLSTTPSALPESVAWLEHLTLEMTTSTNARHGLGKRNVLYELHMTYQTSKDEATTWTLSRPFDESCPSGVEGTRVALLRMLNTVKASLVNHGNLGCSRMRDDVSKVFAVFVSSSTQTTKDLSRVHSSTASTTSSMSLSMSLSPTSFKRSSSSTSLTSDEETQVALEFDDFPCGNFARCECGACRSSLNH